MTEPVQSYLNSPWNFVPDEFPVFFLWSAVNSQKESLNVTTLHHYLLTSALKKRQKYDSVWKLYWSFSRIAQYTVAAGWMIRATTFTLPFWMNKAFWIELCCFSLTPQIWNKSWIFFHYLNLLLLFSFLPSFFFSSGVVILLCEITFYKYKCVHI